MGRAQVTPARAALPPRAPTATARTAPGKERPRRSRSPPPARPCVSRDPDPSPPANPTAPAMPPARSFRSRRPSPDVGRRASGVRSQAGGTPAREPPFQVRLDLEILTQDAAYL